MAIGEAVGYTALGGTMIVPNRAKKLRREFYADTVLSKLMNTDYEGELKKQGDSVTIPRRPVISVGTYSKGDSFTFPTQAAQEAVTLTIDTAKKFEFGIEEIDKIQAYIKGYDQDWLDEAKNRLRIAVETPILNAAGAQASAYNAGLTAGKSSCSFNLGTLANPLHLTQKETYTDPATGITFWNAADLMADFVTVLAEQDITDPNLEKFAIMPPWVVNKIAKSEIKNAEVTGAGTGGIINGPDYIGKVQGIQTYKSNLFTKLTTGGESGQVGVFPVLFGVKEAWSFAAQMESYWSGELQTRAAWGFRGVMAYGYKVVIPEGLGVAYVTAETVLK